jgi:hypothetical protein
MDFVPSRQKEAAIVLIHVFKMLFYYESRP